MSTRWCWCGSRIFKCGALANLGGTAVVLHVGRIRLPVVEADVSVDTRTADELEVADRLDLDEHVAACAVTVVLVLVMLHVEVRVDHVRARKTLLIYVAVLVHCRIHRDHEE